MVLNFKQQLLKCVRLALYEELITYPKPGLVSLYDSGSHQDMDKVTFLSSIKALEEYFTAIIDNICINPELPFIMLNQLGCEAERKMLAVTQNINTHRGAIFILGLLVASITYTYIKGGSYNVVCANLIKLWSKDLFLHQANQDSHGNKVRLQYQLNSIIVDAAYGFPRIFAYQHSYSKICGKYGAKYARLVTFFLIMQELDDTNLVYRGGIKGLIFAKQTAKIILSFQNNPQQFYNRALKLHHEFIRHNLSPGGCADVLAAILLLDKVKKLWG